MACLNPCHCQFARWAVARGMAVKEMVRQCKNQYRSPSAARQFSGAVRQQNRQKFSLDAIRTEIKQGAAWQLRT
jgi:hypothetical protein